MLYGVMSQVLREIGAERDRATTYAKGRALEVGGVTMVASSLAIVLLGLSSRPIVFSPYALLASGVVVSTLVFLFYKIKDYLRSDEFHLEQIYRERWPGMLLEFRQALDESGLASDASIVNMATVLLVLKEHRDCLERIMVREAKVTENVENVINFPGNLTVGHVRWERTFRDDLLRKGTLTQLRKVN